MTGKTVGLDTATRMAREQREWRPAASSGGPMEPITATISNYGITVTRPFLPFIAAGARRNGAPAASSRAPSAAPLRRTRPVRGCDRSERQDGRRTAPGRASSLPAPSASGGQKRDDRGWKSGSSPGRRRGGADGLLNPSFCDALAGLKPPHVHPSGETAALLITHHSARCFPSDYIGFPNSPARAHTGNRRNFAAVGDLASAQPHMLWGAAARALVW
jgi:hypothetical protein